MRVLVRVLMIHVGVVAGCLAAALAFTLIESWNVSIPEDMTREQVHSILLQLTLIIGLIGLAFSYLPSLAVGLVAEALNLRSVIFYAIAGGLIGIIPNLDILPSWVTVTGDPMTATPLKAYPAIGIIGGCAYWLVTGCKAGFGQSNAV
jgi:hypothetical protein